MAAPPGKVVSVTDSLNSRGMENRGPGNPGPGQARLGGFLLALWDVLFWAWAVTLGGSQPAHGGPVGPSQGELVSPPDQC